MNLRKMTFSLLQQMTEKTIGSFLPDKLKYKKAGKHRMDTGILQKLKENTKMKNMFFSCVSLRKKTQKSNHLESTAKIVPTT